ncbi:MAG: hypothetical protein IT365_29735 [Candidatus Hydrogenedentes bacterium]|nr:hypothetical protein [Candidatus Hydrogenedentota bacterium]
MGSKSRVPMLGCLVFVAVVWVLVALAVICLVFVWAGNEEPFDDSDMAVANREVPDDENAYQFLRKTASAATWTESEDASVEAMMKSTPEPSGYPEKFLAANQESLGYLRKALVCEQSYYKEDPSTEASARERGAEAVLWALWHETRRTSGADEQIELALRAIHLGHTLKGNGAPLVPFLRGQSYQAYGYAMLREILATQDPSGELMMRCLGDVVAAQADAPLLADSLRSEYVQLKATLDKELGNRKWRLGVYNDNATKRNVLMQYRQFIENTDRFYRDVVTPPEDEEESVIIMMLKGNAIGNIMSEILIPPMDGIYVSLAYRRSYNSAVQVLLALKVYHMRNGELPETLDVLVPEFFAEVPKDWFDGGPIKYNRDKAIVYCVGKDLADQGGGDPETKWQQSEDPAWAIGFVSPGT